MHGQSGCSRRAHRSTRRICVQVLITILGFLIVPGLHAASITFSVDQLIATNNLAWENYDVTVNGCRVTIDGRHTFRSLTIQSGGLVTHSTCSLSRVCSLDLVIVSNLLIDASSAIDVVGKGYLPGRTSGNTTNGAPRDNAGGSHGGTGMSYNGVETDLGLPYDDHQHPSEPGGGGGAAPADGTAASGGGVIRITAGRITNLGRISADGGPDLSDFETFMQFACGAGGAIDLDADVIDGGGAIRANGGVPAEGFSGAAGAGGRVALHYNTLGSAFAKTNVTALGGAVGAMAGSDAAGCPGTVYFDRKGIQTELLVSSMGKLANQVSMVIPDRVLGWTTIGGAQQNVIWENRLEISGSNVIVKLDHGMPIHLGTLIVTNLARLRSLATTGAVIQRLDLTVTNLVHVAGGSAIDARATGYGAGMTHPATTNGAARGLAGGSHAGYGSVPTYGVAADQPNDVYGDFRAPDAPGAGGAPGSSTGGGVIHLVASTVVVHGVISADGESGEDTMALGREVNAGAAGGSIWMQVGSLSGTGVVSAGGGGGIGGFGCGGGGRVAVWYQTLNGFSPARARARAGEYGGEAAAVGTVFWKCTTNSTEKLVISSAGGSAAQDLAGGFSGAFTPLGRANDPVVEIPVLEVSGTNVCVKPHHAMPFKCDNLSILQGARLSHLQADAAAEYFLELIVASNLLVDATSSIDVTGCGYGPGRTSGNLTLQAAQGHAGGSHGGTGGSSSSAHVSPSYGEAENPALPGGGGATYPVAGHPSGHGGGVIRAYARNIVLDGAIRADGLGLDTIQSATCYAGGAGGSVLLASDTLSGIGRISARGGNGGGIYNYQTRTWSELAGAGGGGRIALFAGPQSAFPSSRLTTSGGSGLSAALNGSTGTVVNFANPTFGLTQPSGSMVHDIVPIHWFAAGVDPRYYLVDVRASHLGVSRLLATGMTVIGKTQWDSRAAPDGLHEIRVTFRDTRTGTTAHEAARFVTVNNAVVWHSGPIMSNEVWEAGRTHMIEGNVTIRQGVTVTIGTGVVVKALDGASLTIGSGGTLNATATGAAAVVFTSFADDTLGGDTNLDGDRSLPRPGSWSGVSAAGGGTLSLSSDVRLRYIRKTYGTVVLATDAVWDGTTLHEIGGPVSVGAGARLTVQAGAIVKFQPGYGITFSSGAILDVDGTVAQPVIFTSIRDDSAGGDHNSDGTATVPEAGDWSMILLNSSVARLNGCELRYGGGPLAGGWGPPGGPGKATIKLSGSSTLTMSNSAMYDSGYDGVLDWGGGATIVNSIFAGCDRAVCAHPGSVVKVVHSTFDDNRIAMLLHGGTMDARNCILAGSLDTGIYNFDSPAPVLQQNLFWNSTNTFGIPPPVGSNGNTGGNPLFKDPARRNYRLAYGSPAIDAAISTFSPATDFMAAPRYSDPRISQKPGTPDAGGVFADLGAFEFTETAASDVDLVVDWVDGPDTARAGATALLRYQVSNRGTKPAVGPWQDRIELMADQPGRGGDRLLVDEPLTNLTLAAGERRVIERVVAVPGGTEGGWRWQVLVNAKGSVFEGREWNNNLSPLSGETRLQVPRLIPGTAVSGEFASASAAQWFAIEQAAGQPLQIDLAMPFTDARARLVAGWNSMPTPYDFELRDQGAVGTHTRLGLPAPPTARTVYLLVDPEVMEPLTPFTLLVEPAPLSLSAFGVPLAGNVGTVTASLRGSGFETDMVVRLLPSAGAPIAASALSVPDGSAAWATFPMNGAVPGPCDVEVSRGGVTSRLAAAAAIAEGGAAQFTMSLKLPDAVRAGRAFRGVVEYVNEGTIDMPVPLVVLRSEAGDPVWLPGSVTTRVGTAVQFLALPPEGVPVPVLAPGMRASVTFASKSERETSSFVADWLEGDDTSSMDWEALRPAMDSPQNSAAWSNAWTEMSAAHPLVMDFVGAMTALALEPASRLKPQNMADYVGELHARTLNRMADASVRGTLVEQGSGVAVAGAVLTASTATGSVMATTAGDGSFSFRGLPAGTTSFRAPGWRPAPVATIGIPASQAVVWRVAEGASLAGRITSGVSNQPVAGVAVQCCVAGADPEAAHAFTDATGYYVIKGLPTGLCTVAVLPEDLVTPAVATIRLDQARTYAHSLALETGGTITGCVLDAASNPVTGASVRVAAAAGGPVRQAVSGAAGTFAFMGLAEGGQNVDAWNESGFGRLTGIVSRASGATGVVIRLDPGCVLTGLVRDAVTGGVLTGAVVQLRRDRSLEPVRTDEAGGYRIAGLPVTSYTWRAYAAGYLTATGSVVFSSGGVRSSNLVLRPAGRIAGTVTSFSQPQAGLNVLLWSVAGAAQRTTDGAGRFLFENLADGTFVLSFGLTNNDVIAQRQVILNAASNRHDLAVELPLHTIAGRLVVPGSTNVSGLAHIERNGVEIGRAELAADGTYQFQTSLTGTFSVVLAGAGLGVERMTGIVIGASTQFAVVPTNVAEGTTVTVRVLSGEPGGAPLTNATVTLRRIDQGRSTPALEFVDQTGVSFHTGVRPGTYQLLVHCDEWAYATTTLTVSATGLALTQQLVRACTLQGRLTAPDTLPVDGAMVHVLLPDGNCVTTFSDTNGTYRATCMPAATVDVWFATARRVPQLIRGVRLQREHAAYADAVLAGSGWWVSGQVTDATSAPMPVPMVEILATNGPLLLVSIGDANGNYRIGPLAGGNYLLRVTQEGCQPVDRAITVTSNLTLTATRLAPGLSSRQAREQMDAEVKSWWPELGDFTLSSDIDLLEPKLMPIDTAAFRVDYSNLYRNAYLDDDDSRCPGVSEARDVCRRSAALIPKRFAEWQLQYEAGSSEANYARGYVLLKSTELGLKVFKAAAAWGGDRLVDASATVLDKCILTTRWVGNRFVDDPAAATAAANAFLKVAASAFDSFSDALQESAKTFPGIYGEDPDEAMEAVTLLKIGESATGELLGILGPEGNNWGDPFKGIANIIESLQVGREVYQYATNLEGEVNAPLQQNFNSIENAQAAYIAAVNEHALNQNYLRRLAAWQCDRCNHPSCMPPPPPRRTGPRNQTGVGRSIDPNDKLTVGFGPSGIVGAGDRLLYTIRFENKTNASLPAAMIRVTDQLDTNLNWHSVELAEVGFNRTVVQVPPGLTRYRTTTNVATDPNPVEVAATFEPTTGLFVWTVRSIDPVTGDLPEDPLAGFLPPNTNAPSGEGYVSYFVNLGTNMTSSGERVTNMATIVFDENLSIDTPAVTNTLDRGQPSSAVAALPAWSDPVIPLTWDGIDDLAGIGQFDVYVSRQGGPFEPLVLATTNREMLFAAEPGVQYRFRSLARDNAGNVEPPKPGADTLTTTRFGLDRVQRSAPGNTILRWQSATGLTYRVVAFTNLVGGAATGTVLVTLPATPPLNTCTDSAVGAGARFYRIEVQP